jgi:HlyD family secretion protein
LAATSLCSGRIDLAVRLDFFLLAVWSPVEVFTLQRGELVQTVVASGRVATPARVDVGTQITGRVAAVPVKEGQTVRAGDLLIELAAADEKAALELAQANVRQAEVRLRQLQQLTQPTAEQVLVQAQANLINVEKQYQRTRELVAQGFVGKAQLDEAQRALDVARSQLKCAIPAAIE